MKQTVYIASPESQQIHVWNLNHEGALTLTQVVDVPGQVQPMVVSPDKRYLYVGVRPEFRVLAYRIAPDDGALTFAAESALPGSPTHISSDDGHLVAQDPAEVTTVEVAGPRHMVFHPNEQYAYCVNELNSSVDVWELKDPHGNIECVQTLDMMPENFSDTRWAADIHITPDGRHLYACDRTASLITVFSVSEDGSVLSKEGFQPTETQPRGFNVDHSGKYLIAAGQKSHHISVYEIVGEQGLLHEKGRYAVGQGPMWVVVNAH